MDENQLRAALRDLHGELERSEVTEAETREALRSVARDIERVLGPEGPTLAEEAEQGGLAGALEEALVGFEAEHPALARLTRRVSNALSSMGI